LGGHHEELAFAASLTVLACMPCPAGPRPQISDADIDLMIRKNPAHLLGVDG
jgi:hypothetical protein